MSSKDLMGIGLTATGRKTLEEIAARGWFPSNESIAKFCMARAIRAGEGEGTTAGTETAWAIGNFDADGDIRRLISALYPTCDTPIRLMEYLIHQGLVLVAPLLALPNLTPSVLLGSEPVQTDF